jgi:multiple sugar transport system ATP-binding protein
MGSETQLFARVGRQKIVGIFKQRLMLKPGDVVGFTPDTAAVHLFDTTTGLRLDM